MGSWEFFLSSWPNLFARILPILVSCIIVWFNIDKLIFRRFLLNEELICKTRAKRDICIGKISDVVDMFTITVGFVVAFLMPVWFSTEIGQVIFFSILAVLSPTLFIVYLVSPPSKYTNFFKDRKHEWWANHYIDAFAFLYLIWGGYLASLYLG